MKRSFEDRMVRLETLVVEWGKDAEIKKLNERISDQYASIMSLQQQLINEQQRRIQAEVNLELDRKSTVVREK